MSGDHGGWLWFAIDVVGVAILGAALAIGTVMWRTRRRRPDIERARDEATREAYESDGRRN